MRKLAIVFTITGIFMLLISFVLHDSIAPAVTLCCVGAAMFREYKELEKKQKYIYEKSMSEHKILYDEMISIKNEYDTANQQKKETKGIKIVFYSIVIVLIFAFLYMSYTSPNGLLHRTIEVADVLTVLFCAWVILFCAYIVLAIFCDNTNIALNKIETKMYSLCMDNNNDEVNVQKLRAFRAKLEKRSFLTKKFKKIRGNEEKNLQEG